MNKIKSFYGRVAVLSLRLMMVYGFANAQCNITLGNYSANCPTQFLSISSNSCVGSQYGSYTITITVNQAGASYTAYPSGASIISASTSGTTLTYELRSSGFSSSVSLAVHMTGGCSNNFAAIAIN